MAAPPILVVAVPGVEVEVRIRQAEAIRRARLRLAVRLPTPRVEGAHPEAARTANHKSRASLNLGFCQEKMIPA